MHYPFEQNRRAWDERAVRQLPHARPASDADFADPSAVINPCGWLPEGVAGRRVLCLAAGGGKHGPLFAAAGATVTVVDLSPKMLELDRELAATRKLAMRLVEASMDDLSPLAEASFDLVIQPVSTCYVPDVEKAYREAARVLVAGGLYISQHKQPVSLQAELTPSPRGYAITEAYFRTGPLPPVSHENAVREAGAREYLHPWEELIGGLCRSGFVLEDLVEPRHADANAAPGAFGHRSQFVPPYVTLKARRTAQPTPARATMKIWTPF
jgi:SAM-dependent methyltransferase